MSKELESSEIRSLFAKVMTPITFDSIPPKDKEIIQQGKMEVWDTVETVLKGD